MPGTRSSFAGQVAAGSNPLQSDNKRKRVTSASINSSTKFKRAKHSDGEKDYIESENEVDIDNDADDDDTFTLEKPKSKNTSNSRNTAKQELACITRDMNKMKANHKKELQQKDKDLAALSRKLKQKENEYQSLFEKKAKQAGGGTVVSDDFNLVLSRVGKVFDTAKQWARKWAAQESDHISKLSSVQRLSLTKLLTGKGPLDRISIPEVVVDVMQHELATRIVLESCLNHFLCKNIIMHPLGFLGKIKGASEALEEDLNWLYNFTYDGGKAKAALWRSMLVQCFATSEADVQEKPSRIDHEILAARDRWYDNLANDFLELACGHMLKPCGGIEAQKCRLHLLGVLKDAGNLASYSWSQGYHVKCAAWSSISRTTKPFSTTSNNMMLHPTMQAYRGEDYDVESFNGRNIEYLVCPRLSMFGREGVRYDDGRTILKSVHWFMQSEERIVRENEQAQPTAQAEDQEIEQHGNEAESLQNEMPSAGDGTAKLNSELNRMPKGDQKLIADYRVIKDAVDDPASHLAQVDVDGVLPVGSGKYPGKKCLVEPEDIARLPPSDHELSDHQPLDTEVQKFTAKINEKSARPTEAQPSTDLTEHNDGSLQFSISVQHDHPQIYGTVSSQPPMADDHKISKTISCMELDEDMPREEIKSSGETAFIEEREKAIEGEREEGTGSASSEAPDAHTQRGTIHLKDPASDPIVEHSESTTTTSTEPAITQEPSHTGGKSSQATQGKKEESETEGPLQDDKWPQLGSPKIVEQEVEMTPANRESGAKPREQSTRDNVAQSGSKPGGNHDNNPSDCTSQTENTKPTMQQEILDHQALQHGEGKRSSQPGSADSDFSMGTESEWLDACRKTISMAE